MSDDEEETGDDDAGDVPGDSDEVKQTKRVVRITADLLEVAVQVIEEMDHRDGKQFATGAGSDPSLAEMCGVATLIMTGRMSGIYAPKEKGPQANDPRDLSKTLKTLVEVEVSLALSRARLRPGPTVPPVPAYVPQPLPTVPPPRPKSDLIEILEKMSDRMRTCACIQTGVMCDSCKKTEAAEDVFMSFLGPEERNRPFGITCDCGALMEVHQRPDGSRGLKCPTCQDRPRATAKP